MIKIGCHEVSTYHYSNYKNNCLHPFVVISVIIFNPLNFYFSFIIITRNCFFYSLFYEVFFYFIRLIIIIMLFYLFFLHWQLF